MSTKKPKLTADLIETICTRLKAGAFEKVAVESLGVSWATYQEWLNQAARPNCGTIHRMLADAVMQARAHARFMAEMEMREKDAKVWLLQGPGRRTPTQEGWGSGDKPAAAAETGEARALLFELCAVLLKALTPFPEARAVAAEVVGRFQAEQKERQAAASNDTLCHS